MAPLKEVLGAIGINVESISSATPSFGASLKQEGGKVIVRSVRAGSAAEEAGLSVNDEIIGCKGFRVDQGAFEGFVSSLDNGQDFNILIAREEILYELDVKMSLYEKPQFSLKFDNSPAKTSLRNYWLRTL